MSIEIVDMRERLQRFLEHMVASSERSMGYWKEVPLHRLGDKYLDRTKDMIECVTTGEGDIKKIGMELAFMSFLMSEQGPYIQELMSKTRGAPVHEIRVDPDAEREKEDKAKWSKKKGKKADESWRG